MQATEAGKETELSEIKESIPNQANNIRTMPAGTASHAVNIRCRESLATCSKC